MRQILKTAPGAIAVLAMAVGAAAGPITNWNGLGSVSASAYSAIHDSTVTCFDSHPYSGTLVIEDSLFCAAEIGYGFGAASLRLTTYVTDLAVSTDVALGGGGQGFLNDVGGGQADFDQVAQLTLGSPASVQLSGTLEAEDLSSSTVEIRNAGGVVASYTADHSFQPVTLNDSVALDPGDHEIAILVRCRPHSDGPGGQTNGSAAASVFASLAPAVSAGSSVAATPWARIKSLYR